MDLRSVFSHNLRRFRKARKLSQEQLADAAGLDRSYISLLETGTYYASLKVIEKLATALDLPASELLREERTTDTDATPHGRSKSST